MNKGKGRAVVAVAAVLIMLALALSGCRPVVAPASQEIYVYATFFPIYALTDAVMRGVPNARLHCLVQPQDGCLRDYRLSDWDVALLSKSADAVIMGGRGLESFESALFAWGESGPAVSAVLYNLRLYNQEDPGTDDEQQSHLIGANPHLYMSVEGAKEIVQSVSAMLVSLDPAYAERYAANTETALAELDALQARANALLADCAGRRVILMNEALIYAAEDYGLEVAEWIDREPGTGLYDDSLQACLERLAGAEAEVVLIERQAPARLTEALEAAGYAVARIDILSTHREKEGFDAYIGAQTANAEAVRDAFGRANEMEAAH